MISEYAFATASGVKSIGIEDDNGSDKTERIIRVKMISY